MCGFPCVHVQISASCIIVQVIVASNIPVMSTGIGGRYVFTHVSSGTFSVWYESKYSIVTK
jgi:hypothetical protein